MKKCVKGVLKALLCVVIAVLLAVGIYVAYVFIDYYRLDDMLPLDTTDAVPGKTDAVKTDTDYTIITWNLGFGAYSGDYTFFMDGGKYSRAYSKEAVYKNISAATGFLAESGADFMFIQELDTDSTRSYHVDQRELLADALPSYYRVFAQNYDSPYLFYPIFSPHGKSVSGMMTLTSFGTESALRRSLPIEGGFMKLIDLDRCYTVTRVPVENGKELCLYNIHLSAYSSDGSIADEQLKMLVSDMLSEYEAGNYVVCGSDFNKDLLGDSSEYFGVSCGDATWAKPIPEGVIPEELTVVACSNAPSCRNNDMAYTPGKTFVITVDGFIVSPNVEIEEACVENLGFENSDHNPVKLVFRLG